MAAPHCSTLILPVPEAEAAVGAFRLRYDQSAAFGAPAHVTLIFPFAPAPVGGDLLRELRDVFAGFAPLELRFAAIGRFPETLYLAPSPAEPIAAMVRALVARWPQWPPYGGAHATFIPHLTVADGQADTLLLDWIGGTLTARLPFDAIIRDASLLESDAGGFWHERARFPLAGGPATAKGRSTR